MPEITGLEPARRPAGYLSLEVDGVDIGAISERDANQLGLVMGQHIDEGTLREAQLLVGRAEGLRLANAFIGHRPRSTTEVRQRLRRAKLDSAAIDSVVEALIEQGLLDDKRFADLWVENRTTFKPRSSRMLEMELRQKGIDRATAKDALASSVGLDETHLAVEAGRQRMRRLATADRAAFERSMGAFLVRRGFGYDAVRSAVETLWSEIAAE